MPIGSCRYPQHHGPSAGPPLGLLAGVAAGAVIVAAWHVVLVVVSVVAVLGMVAGAVMLLWHSHTAQPYDAQTDAEQPADRVHVTAGAVTLAARVAALEAAQAAQLEGAAQAAQLEGGQHVHLHLHGPAGADLLAAVLDQDRPAIEWPGNGHPSHPPQV